VNFEIFLFTCRFIMILQLFKYCEYDPWEFFIHLFFLFFFPSPNFIVHDIIVFLHVILHHTSPIMSYVSMVVAFVTFNIVERRINISFLNIYSTRSTIYKFMSKFITSKIVTRKETWIPGSEFSFFDLFFMNSFLF